MWWEDSTQSNLFGGKRVFFAHWVEKNWSGAKIHDDPLDGMNKNRIFCHFLGYEYKKHI
jgi:hypothetical protein